MPPGPYAPGLIGGAKPGLCARAEGTVTTALGTSRASARTTEMTARNHLIFIIKPLEEDVRWSLPASSIPVGTPGPAAINHRDRALPTSGKDRKPRPLGGRRAALIDQSQQLSLPSQRPERHEDELHVDEALAVREPRLGVLALQGRRHRVDHVVATDAAVDFQPELDHREEIVLLQRDLPVGSDTRDVAEELREELGVEVAPGARDLLVDPPANRGEAPKRQPTRAAARQPSGDVARAISEQRHDRPIDRGEDDLSVAGVVGTVDLDHEVEFVDVIAVAPPAFEPEDGGCLRRGIGHTQRRVPEPLELGAEAWRHAFAPADEELHGHRAAAVPRDLAQPARPERIADEHVEAVRGETLVRLAWIDAPDKPRENRRITTPTSTGRRPRDKRQSSSRK